MALARMPNAPNSMDNVLVNPMTPHLLVHTHCAADNPAAPRREDMLMIDPAGDFFRCGMASRVTLNVPPRFTRITRSHSAGDTCSTGAVCPRDAAVVDQHVESAQRLDGLAAPRLLSARVHRDRSPLQ
jgi:hypothetical protein